jgi:hypothetical protein
MTISVAAMSTLTRYATGLAAAVALIVATPVAAHAETGWHQVSDQIFIGTAALERSQGATTDGAVWYFSWQYGLSKVSLDGRTVLARNAPAIPATLAAQGDDHIGDIDYANGRLYAPIEDSNGYQHPYVAVYDPATLTYTGTAYPLPLSLSVGGVPWVAVDPARGYAYTAEWDPTSVLNVFNLSDFSLVRTVPLSQTVGRIQGAKVYQGQLYASADNATKSIYRIDPASGTVATVYDRNLPSGSEAEGLAVLPTGDGAVLHALDVAPLKYVNFRGLAPTG